MSSTGDGSRPTNLRGAEGIRPVEFAVGRARELSLFFRARVRCRWAAIVENTGSIPPDSDTVGAILPMGQGLLAGFVANRAMSCPVTEGEVCSAHDDSGIM